MKQAKAIWQIIAVAELGPTGPGTTPPSRQADARSAADGAGRMMRLLSLAVDGIVLCAGTVAAIALVLVALS